MPRISRRRLGLAVAAAIALVLLPVGYFFGTTILNIATDQGQVVIEVDDPGIEVTVKEKGAVISDAKGKPVITLKAGEKDLEITVKEANEDVFTLTKQFTLIRGGKKVLNIRQEIAMLPKPVPEKTPPAFPDGFVSLFNGKDLSGWKVHEGNLEAWGAKDGLLFNSGGGPGYLLKDWLLTEKEFTNFEFRLEYKVPVNGNSGVALRAPLEGNPTYQGMEIQILDDAGPAYVNFRPNMHTGSIYDVVAPSKRVTKTGRRVEQHADCRQGPPD